MKGLKKPRPLLLGIAILSAVALLAVGAAVANHVAGHRIEQEAFKMGRGWIRTTDRRIMSWANPVLLDGVGLS
jgi:hypothetical protein